MFFRRCKAIFIINYNCTYFTYAHFSSICFFDKNHLINELMLNSILTVWRLFVIVLLSTEWPMFSPLSQLYQYINLGFVAAFCVYLWNSNPVGHQHQHCMDYVTVGSRIFFHYTKSSFAALGGGGVFTISSVILCVSL